jgi:2-methylcitrate dehydratase PrpD
MAQGLTWDFVQTIAAAHADWLRDSAVLSAAGALVTDGIAVAAAGAAEPGPEILAAHFLALGGSREDGSVVIARSARLRPTDAALVNGAAMHVLDFEPMWNPANHSVSTVLPALLALAGAPMRQQGRPAPDGAALLAALAAGVEVQARLRRASRQFEPGDLVFHPPGLVGPPGAAVACGLLLGLPPEGLVAAIGIAASRAGGLQANVGSMTKALHCGGAAASGLDAALLAARGFGADPDALDGPRGYLTAFFGAAADRARLTEDPPPAVIEPGPAFKFYPSQYGTHFVIEAALAARAALPPGTGSDALTGIEIVAPPMPYVDRPAPPSGLAGKFSLQYVAAVALLDGRVGLESFTDARRYSADLEALLERVRIRPDASRQGRFDRMRVDLNVELADGSRVSGACDGPPGIWGRPAPAERLAAKAHACIAGSALAPSAEAILAALDGLERLDAAGLEALVERLGCPY